MTELLITVMNAPKALQRALALTMLFCLAGAVLLAIAWLTGMAASKLDAIQLMRQELYRLEQMIAHKPSKIQPLPSRTNDIFIEGDTLSSMQAKLQERINAMAVGSGATIASVSGLPQMEVEGVRYVGVRVSTDASLRSLHDLARQIEVSMPPLIIRQASLRNVSRISQGKLAEEIRLSGQIIVYGAANPSAKLPDAVRR